MPESRGGAARVLATGMASVFVLPLTVGVFDFVTPILRPPEPADVIGEAVDRAVYIVVFMLERPQTYLPAFAVLVGLLGGAVLCRRSRWSPADPEPAEAR